MSTNARHTFLDKVFALVSDPRDWRAPIQKRVPKSKLEAMGATVDDIRQAVFDTTASMPEIAETETAYVVKGVGYRHGPAGP